MATANFKTMELFPLYVIDTVDMDDDDVRLIVEDMELHIRFANDNCKFFHIGLCDGYYTGIQLFVEFKLNAAFDSVEEMDNDDTWYYYDMCRSAALRKYKSEINKIRRWMNDMKRNFPFIELGCVGRFGNGEAVYNVIG